ITACAVNLGSCAANGKEQRKRTTNRRCTRSLNHAVPAKIGTRDESTVPVHRQFVPKPNGGGVCQKIWFGRAPTSERRDCPGYHRAAVDQKGHGSQEHQYRPSVSKESRSGRCRPVRSHH